VDDLLVNEASTGERFLAWKSVSSDDLAATPTSLDIGELRLDRPGLKLVIFKDKSTSIAKAFQKAARRRGRRRGGEAGPGTRNRRRRPRPGRRTMRRRRQGRHRGETRRHGDRRSPAFTGRAARPGRRRGKADPAFRVNIERVRVNQGEMDFADLSLALPFGTASTSSRATSTASATGPAARPSWNWTAGWTNSAWPGPWGSWIPSIPPASWTSRWCSRTWR
jgi:hypothetical protein